MGKKKRRKHYKQVSDKAADTEAGVLAAYLSDPIALWQDGDYEAVDALYAPGGLYGGPPMEPVERKGTETAITEDEGEDDELPF